MTDSYPSRTVRFEPASHLTPAEARTCRRLSFRDRGLLDEWLKVARKRTRPDRDETVFRIFEKDLLVAWGMVYVEATGFACVGIYTRKAHRGCGLGGTIRDAMLSHWNRTGGEMRHGKLRVSDNHSAKARALYADGKASGKLRQFF